MSNLREMDANFRKALDGSAGYFQLSPMDQANIAGVKRATWYRRLKQPENFTLREFRRMVKHYSWDSATVAAIVGVK